MAQSKPPSPPLSNSGLNQLMLHNASSPSNHDEIEYNEETQAPPRGESTFASPLGAYQDGNFHYGSQHSPFTYQHQDHEQELGLNYVEYHPENNPYALTHNEHPLLSGYYGTPARSSSTPSMSTPLSDTMRTRSGLAFTTAPRSLKPLPQSRVKPSRSPKVKKARKEKTKPEMKMAKLIKPLSELTKDWDHVPIVDIEAYVNRSAEERRKEVENGKVPGKVKRPMNSFMLYRKAYQNRTKNWCLQNNHQVVSQVCGESWPLEPDSVREQFNEWARVERTNHQNAHPGYKFSPSKGVTTKTAKRKISDESDRETDISELEEYNWQEEGTGRHKKQMKSVSSGRGNTNYSTTNSLYSYSRENTEEPPFGECHPSSYQRHNPGRAIPPPYNQSGLIKGQYYQATVHSNASHPPGLVEDVRIRMTAAPGARYDSLPRRLPYVPLNSYQSQEEYMTPTHRIDPSLIAQNNSTYDTSFVEQESTYLGGSFNDDSQWIPPYSDIGQAFYEERQEYTGVPQGFTNLLREEQHMQMLKGSQDAWSVEPLTEGQEFDKWMHEV